MRIIFLAFILFVSPVFAENRPEILFDQQIEVPLLKNWVLGDFVKVNNPTPMLLESLENFVVTKEQVEKGFNIQSVRELYKSLVLQNPAVAAENPKLIVSQKIDIKMAHAFSEIHFRRKLTNHLSSQCHPCEVKIQKVLIPAKIMMDAQIDWSEVKLAPSLLISLLQQEEKNLQVQWISVTVKIKKNVLVALRNINFGERISEKDFEARWIDVSFSKEEPLTFELIKKYQLAAQPIMKHRMILPSQLKEEPATHKGQSVKAVIGEDGIEISMSAVAEETGKIGDLIKIKNPENKKIMSATIIEKGVVRIQ